MLVPTLQAAWLPVLAQSKSRYEEQMAKINTETGRLQKARGALMVLLLK